jgi:hypothetical protein
MAEIFSELFQPQVANILSLSISAAKPVLPRVLATGLARETIGRYCSLSRERLRALNVS